MPLSRKAPCLHKYFTATRNLSATRETVLILQARDAHATEDACSDFVKGKEKHNKNSRNLLKYTYICMKSEKNSSQNLNLKLEK